MGGKDVEACGRCSVTTAVDAAASGGDDEGSDGAGGVDPFDGERIEVEDDRLRSVVRHEVLSRRVKDRLDDLAMRLIYG